MTMTDRQRANLDVQGFLDVDDKQVARWLRFSPAMCTIGFAVGTALHSAVILYIMGLMAVIGLSMHHTPFDWFYNVAISPVLGTPTLPKRPAPARFACFVAVVWSALTASAFLAKFTTAGVILGTALTIAAGLLAVRNYCIASVIWRKIYGWPDR
jgi:hypothetical protein